MPSFYAISWRRIVKVFWLALGCVSFALGTAGIVLPLLPTVPFYMLTLFCFAKSSTRLHSWFRRSDFYKKHLADFMEKKSMTRKKKATLLGMTAAMMASGVCLANAPWPVGFVIAVIWCIQAAYFTFGIKTER